MNRAPLNAPWTVPPPRRNPLDSGSGLALRPSPFPHAVCLDRAVPSHVVHLSPVSGLNCTTCRVAPHEPGAAQRTLDGASPSAEPFGLGVGLGFAALAIPSRGVFGPRCPLIRCTFESGFRA